MSKINAIISDIEEACYDWLAKEGYTDEKAGDWDITRDDFMNDYMNIEIAVDGVPRRGIVEIRAELSYDGMYDLCTYLDPVIQKYDSDAYFEMEEPGISVAYINPRLLLA